MWCNVSIYIWVCSAIPRSLNRHLFKLHVDSMGFDVKINGHFNWISILLKKFLFDTLNSIWLEILFSIALHSIFPIIDRISLQSKYSFWFYSLHHTNILLLTIKYFLVRFSQLFRVNERNFFTSELCRTIHFFSNDDAFVKIRMNCSLQLWRFLNVFLKWLHSNIFILFLKFPFSKLQFKMLRIDG